MNRIPCAQHGVLNCTACPHASLSTDAAARKAAPLAEGVLWYFPNALAAVAAVSKAGNDQHNPGQPMHHARGKSSDHADCALRHLIDAGKIDTDGQRHTAKAAWRILALLQEEIERDEGVPLPRNAKAAEPSYEGRLEEAKRQIDAEVRAAKEQIHEQLRASTRASLGFPPNYPRTDTGD